MSASYSVSAVLEGHSADVRCVATAPPILGARFSLATGSRDGTARLWSTTPESKDQDWRCDRASANHDSYVSAITSAPPTEKFPQVRQTLTSRSMTRCRNSECC